MSARRVYDGKARNEQTECKTPIQDEYRKTDDANNMRFVHRGLSAVVAPSSHRGGVTA